MASENASSIGLGQDRSRDITASVTTVLTLAIMSTCLRLMARRMKKIRLNASDLTVIIALFCGICQGATIYTGISLRQVLGASARLTSTGIHYGFGRHVQTVEMQDLETFLKVKP